VAQSLVGARSTTGLASLDGRLQRFAATSVQKMFRHTPFQPDSGTHDISRILKVAIPEHLDPVAVARELARDPNVEYAQPLYMRRLCEVPNDPRYPEQHYLPHIHAPEARDVEQGDSSVILAIVDTGVDCDHEDLAANIWTNAAEASGAAGIDDDGNGHIDDIHGWDFGDGDADSTDPSTESGGHGTHCAGIACAVTNNQRGVAGVSWHCRVMPVKVSPDENSEFVIHPLEGIIYAADKGASRCRRLRTGAISASRLGPRPDHTAGSPERGQRGRPQSPVPGPPGARAGQRVSGSHGDWS
jgi:serine protease